MVALAATLKNNGMPWPQRDKSGKADISKWDRTKTECHRCHERGHFAYECPAPHPVKDPKNLKGDGPKKGGPTPTVAVTSPVPAEGQKEAKQ